MPTVATRPARSTSDGLTAADRAAVRDALPSLAAEVARKVAGGADAKRAGVILDALFALAESIGEAHELVAVAYEEAEYDARETASVKAAEEAAPAPTPSPAPEDAGPFTDREFSFLNSWTFGHQHTASGHNAELRQLTDAARDEARATLERWGTLAPGDPLPDDVERAVQAVRASWVTWTRNDTRAFEKAPGAYAVGPSAAARISRRAIEQADTLRRKGSDAVKSAKDNLAAAIRRHSPRALAVVRPGDENGPDKLRARIEERKTLQERMKAANRVVRGKGTDDEKAARLVALGVPTGRVPELLHPREAWMGLGYPSYSLSNNLSEIKRLESRLVDFEREASRPSTGYAFDGGSVEDNADDNRVQIIFDARQPRDVVDKLKARGFRWSPKNSAWQRVRTSNALRDALQLTGAASQATAAEVTPDTPPTSPAERGVPFAVPTGGLAMRRTLGRSVSVLFSADGVLAERGQYEILSYQDVVASHNPDCTANVNHRLPGAQPRDRSAKDLCRQADQIAAKLNPAVLVALSASAFDGPPVVTADGIVIQGNGRTISLRVAYERYPRQAAAYRAFLVEHAADFGFTPEDVEFFRTPVLVRTVKVDDARAVRLGNALNTAEAPQAPLDRAKAVARSLPLDKRRSLGAAVQALLDATDADTLRGALDAPDAVHLIDRLPGIERNGLVGGGGLTTGGKDLLRDVLVALLVDDGTPGVNARYEALPFTARGGVERSLGHLVALVGTPHDLGPRLRAASEIVRRVRTTPSLTRAADVLAQADAFEASPFTDDDAALADLLLTAKTQRDVAQRLAAYARLSTGYTTLFETVPPARPDEAFRRAIVEGERPNGLDQNGLAVACLGRAVELRVASQKGRAVRYADPDGDTLLVWLPEMRRLLLVPAARSVSATAAARRDAGRRGALASYRQWLHATPDGDALALDLPPAALAPSLPRAARVGTGRSIRYLSDKRMRPGDRKGLVNGYHHDFDSGRRAVHEIPYPTGGLSVLVVSDLAIDGRGILN